MNYQRIIKSLMVLTIACYFLLVIFNNLTDYMANFNYVSHVMSMDTTFPNNSSIWRSITHKGFHHFSYALIILWEIIVCFVCSKASLLLFKNIKNDHGFTKAKQLANLGIGLGLILWFAGFIIVGGEWFLMWQSATWNGQMPAFGMFSVMGILLIFVNQND